MDGGTDRRAARAQCSGSHVVFTLDREIVRRCCKSSHISLDAPGGRAAGATWVAACHIRLVTQPQGVIVHMTRGFPLSSVIRVLRYVDSTSLEEISLLGRQHSGLLFAEHTYVSARSPSAATEVSRLLSLSLLAYSHLKLATTSAAYKVSYSKSVKRPTFRRYIT